jgi:hypothetical protein
LLPVVIPKSPLQLRSIFNRRWARNGMHRAVRFV